MKEIIQSNYYNFCFLFIYFLFFSVANSSSLSRNVGIVETTGVRSTFNFFCVCFVCSSSSSLLGKNLLGIDGRAASSSLSSASIVSAKRLFIFEFDGAGCDEVFGISSKIHSKYLYAVGSSKKSQKPSNCGFIFLFTLSGKCRTHRKTRSQIRVMYK